MAYSPKALREIERSVPERAAKAVRQAYRKSLNAGHSVLIIEDGKLCRVSPDLSKTVLRSVRPAIKIAKGTKFKIK
ncbi:MAG: hypothetical protein JST12_18680 [Armatimonadetes bacterium]|nr:hypothetical protein [Armatimonadota bacterium]